MNIVPAACRALIDTIECGDLVKARALNFQVIRPTYELIRKSSNTIGTIKAGLWLRELEVGIPRLPGLALDINAELRSEFERIFKAEADLTGSTSESTLN